MTEKGAVDIMGRSAVLLSHEVFGLWKSWPQIDRPPVIRYYPETLQNCRHANNGGARWRLICITGRSLLYLRFQRGLRQERRVKPPCFLDDSWMGGPAPGSNWIREEHEPTFILININGQFGGLTHNGQDVELGWLNWERPAEAAIAEAVFSLSILKREDCIRNTTHWGGKKIGGKYPEYSFDMKTGQFLSIRFLDNIQSATYRKVIPQWPYDF